MTNWQPTETATSVTETFMKWTDLSDVEEFEEDTERKGRYGVTVFFDSQEAANAYRDSLLDIVFAVRDLRPSL